MADPKSTTSDKEIMIEACKTGSLDALKILFHEHDIKPNSPPISPREETPDCAPVTSTLFAAAISYHHEHIVRYLFSIYPKVNMWDGAIAGALMKPPLDVDMLKVVCEYSPEIARFEYDDHQTSILSEACRGGASHAPFVHVLLDYGALDDGMNGSYTYNLGGPLLSAVHGDQPIDIIRNMTAKTHCLNIPIQAAFARGRASTLEILLDEEKARGQASFTDATRLRSWLADAQRLGEKDMVDVLERQIKSRERQARMGSRANWAWPFSRTRTETNGKPEEKGGAAVASGSSNSWWALSKYRKKPELADTHSEKKQIEDSSSDED